MRYHLPAGLLLLALFVVMLAVRGETGGGPDVHAVPGATVGADAVENPHGRMAGNPNPDIHELIDADEKFTYEVRYGFLRLGNVYVYLKGDTVHRGTEAVHMVTEMISNRRIPLVGHREHRYHSFMAVNDTIPYGLRFWHDSIHDERMERYLFDFDYEAGYVYSYEDGELIDTLDLDQPADGGPGVMYYSRLFAGTDQERAYPIFIDHDQSEVLMNFSSESVSYNSKAFPDREIRAYTMDGYAGFDGPFGFSGEFTAYFMDDELRIPLEARVSIWVGSVRVRLAEYERLN